MEPFDCPNCKKRTTKHAKGLCITCYKKTFWKPKKAICKRCGREMPIHAKGLCAGCYNFVFHLEKTKAGNYRKWHNIDLEIYKKVTKSCIICGFEKIVELHHLDENKQNSLGGNLIGLCPNHHKMIHNFKFKQGIQDLLREKGFNLIKDKKLDFKFNSN